jgi:hypothetical protein
VGEGSVVPGAGDRRVGAAADRSREPEGRGAARRRGLGFCRSYYFAFYVIERYVDPGYRFSGLGSFVLYVVRGRKPPR